jgi:hypothetical protein
MGRSIVPRTATKHGYIYFFQARDGLVKIGKSIDPAARLKTLSRRAGHQLVVIGAMWSKNVLVEEAAIHRKCADSLFRDEWFRPEVLPKVEGYRARFLTKLPIARQTQLRKRHCKHVNLRLPGQLVRKIEIAARRDQRSLNSMFEVIVSKWAKENK